MRSISKTRLGPSEKNYLYKKTHVFGHHRYDVHLTCNRRIDYVKKIRAKTKKNALSHATLRFPHNQAHSYRSVDIARKNTVNHHKLKLKRLIIYPFQ